MRINVKQEHIDRGYENKANHLERECTCPVALAILEQVPGVTSAFVTYNNVGVTIVNKRRTKKRIFNLPQSVTKFITAFDSFQHVEPQSFNIPLEA